MSRHPRIVPRKVILQCGLKANPRHRVTCLARANLVLDNVKVVPGHLRPSRLSRLLEGSNARFLGRYLSDISLVNLYRLL